MSSYFISLQSDCRLNFEGTKATLCSSQEGSADYYTMIFYHHAYTSVLTIIKGKGKVFPLPARLWPRGWVEVWLHSSMTATLEGGEWSAAGPSRALPSGKTRYPLYRRLGGPQGRSGWAENLASPGFDPQTVQPVVSCCTD